MLQSLASRLDIDGEGSRFLRDVYVGMRDCGRGRMRDVVEEVLNRLEGARRMVCVRRVGWRKGDVNDRGAESEKENDGDGDGS